jgi:uncharacterized protein (TIGR02466 family)
MKIQTIFPTSLLFENINRDITQKELDIVNNYNSNLVGNIGNFRTQDTKVLDYHFSDIKQFIENNIKSYVETIIIPDTDLHFYITQSWINYNHKGSYHHSHNHSNSIISGVFYFSANSEVDCISFDKGAQDSILIKPKTCNWYNSKAWTFPVKTGDLILFPSTLHHSVPPKADDSLRVSLAFNVFAKGNIGDDFSLNLLHL